MGLKEKGGGLQNGTMDEEYFATSVKPRRKHPKEVRLKCRDILSLLGSLQGWSNSFSPRVGSARGCDGMG